MTEVQAKHMDTETAPSVNRIHGNNGKQKRKGENVKSDKKCYRCGKQGHFARDLSCPARDQNCRKCGQIGHFMKCCMTKPKSNK